MSVELKLKANLKRYAGGSETIRVDIESGQDLLAIMEDLGIPVNEVMFFCLNGKRVGGDYVPRNGDSVEVIPAITGG
ncbi:MAG: MoaD/ThiS family protein [Candidatus Tritonobacter lacicola]|nr:MoaD/ThiS family protein [Candidatus Tritonobacter lacicola]